MIGRKPILNGYSVTKIQYLKKRAEIEIRDLKKSCLIYQTITFGCHIFCCREAQHAVITTLLYIALTTEQETSAVLLPMRVSHATAHTDTHTMLLQGRLTLLPPSNTTTTKLIH